MDNCCRKCGKSAFIGTLCYRHWLERAHYKVPNREFTREEFVEWGLKNIPSRRNKHPTLRVKDENLPTTLDNIYWHNRFYKKKCRICGKEFVRSGRFFFYENRQKGKLRIFCKICDIERREEFRREQKRREGKL